MCVCEWIKVVMIIIVNSTFLIKLFLFLLIKMASTHTNKHASYIFLYKFLHNPLPIIALGKIFLVDDDILVVYVICWWLANFFLKCWLFCVLNLKLFTSLSFILVDAMHKKFSLFFICLSVCVWERVISQAEELFAY